ncbi:MAG: hypothetical protein JO037_08970 [Actinobacteria bacterium]|nr:hypothetical protein [Actinomycetota bacterium]
MLVIAMETRSLPSGPMRWAGRRHDDDRPDASSGASSAELFDTVFRALHDGEQVALGFDCPLSAPADQGRAADGTDALLGLAEPAVTRPGIAELGQVLEELGRWRPWTRVSTSLPRWKANTSILVWEAVPAEGAEGIAASVAADSFFRQLHTPAEHGPDAPGRPVVNLAAAVAYRAGLLADASELARPVASVAVAGG